MILRPGVTEADAMSYVNEYQQRHSLPVMDRRTWRQSVRPLAEEDKATWKSGGVVLYDARFVQQMAEYIAKRRVLIQSKREGWHAKSSYNLDDMRALVDDGSLDGEIDHPLFAIVLPRE